MLHELAANIVPVTAIVFIFGGGAIQHFIRSISKAIEMRAAQQNGVNAETAQAIAEMRREIAALRETSTQFDMSFDAAITRLEQRMNFVEGQTVPATMPKQTAPAYNVSVADDSREIQTVGAGRGA